MQVFALFSLSNEDLFQSWVLKFLFFFLSMESNSRSLHVQCTLWAQFCAYWIHWEQDRPKECKCHLMVLALKSERLLHIFINRHQCRVLWNEVWIVKCLDKQFQFTCLPASKENWTIISNKEHHLFYGICGPLKDYRVVKYFYSTYQNIFTNLN